LIIEAELEATGRRETSTFHTFERGKMAQEPATAVGVGVGGTGVGAVGATVTIGESVRAGVAVVCTVRAVGAGVAALSGALESDGTAVELALESALAMADGVSVA